MFTLTVKPQAGSLQKFLAKFKNDAEPLIGQPWRDMLEDVAQDAEEIAKSNAPRASGKLASSIRSRVAKSVRPKWVKVEESATRSSRRYKRYPYPRRLEYDPRRGHQGWFTRPLEHATPTFESKMQRFGGKVRERWGA
jgi:hypothetical protein